MRWSTDGLRLNSFYGDTIRFGPRLCGVLSSDVAWELVFGKLRMLGWRGRRSAPNRLGADPKIAFLFLVYDRVEQEQLWRSFFESAYPGRFTVYVHYKQSRRLGYFKHFKLKRCVPTKWAHVSIVHAHNLLLRSALEDDKNVKFVNLSQSCVPLKPFDYVYDFLVKDDMAHFNVMPTTQCFPRCDSLLDEVPRACIRKSSNWFILNRRLAQVVSGVDPSRIDRQYGEIFCPEEHFFLTEIAQHGLEGQVLATSNLADGATTFTNWADMDYPWVSDEALKNYNRIGIEEVRHLLRAPCLFGRKFSRDCVISETHQSLADFIRPEVT
jgi:hypothetical protein